MLNDRVSGATTSDAPFTRHTPWVADIGEEMARAPLEVYQCSRSEEAVTMFRRRSAVEATAQSPHVERECLNPKPEPERNSRNSKRSASLCLALNRRSTWGME